MNKNAHAKERGFALVTTLMLMLLLGVLALGMLSLSSISLRSESQSSAMSEARANARMALMLALGELQKNAGLDTRITASADILNSTAPGEVPQIDNPSVVGVWRSWEGSDHEPTGILSGRPKAPVYSAKRETEASGGRFVSWLVSGAAAAGGIDQVSALASKVATVDSVAMVAGGSVGVGDDRQVHLPLQTLENGGKFAWWVSGENQKAHLPRPYTPKSDDAARWSDSARSHAVADPEVFELESLLTDPTPALRTFTRHTADLFSKQGAIIQPSQSFHDLSATSVGLLTNTATGGWRKDLSLLTEKWDVQPLTDLPFFQLTPSQSNLFTRPVIPAAAIEPTEKHRPKYSLFYHWSDYGPKTDSIFYDAGAVSSWHSLAHFATLYRNPLVTRKASGQLSMSAQTWPYKSAINTFYGLHHTRFFPMMTRYHFVMSHYAIPSTTTPGMFIPCILYTPVFTLWNPYNYELVVNQSIGLRIDWPLPHALRYTIGGVPYEYHSFQWSSTPYTNQTPPRIIANNWQVNYTFPTPITLKPGQTLVLSPRAGALNQMLEFPRGNTNTISSINLDIGLRTSEGLYCRLDQILDPMPQNTTRSNPSLVELPGSTAIKVDAKFDAPRSGGIGLKAQWALGSMNTNTSNAIIAGRYLPAEADALYPPLENLADTTLGESAGNPVPFMSIIFGSRIASRTIMPTKGMVQNNPLIYTTATGNAQDEIFRGRNNKIYPGCTNLINSPWDFSFVKHATGPADPQFPNVDVATNGGFIVTGFTAADGISNSIVSEFPTRPIASLVELTHWHMRGINPVPPFGMNVIGNSDATPLLPPDKVVRTQGNNAANGRDNMQQDDSYCANHVLFDDWFFSSIAPEPTDFGSAGQTMKDNYTDFLMGTDPLVNRSYRPIREDKATTAPQADKTHTDRVAPTDSWRTIGSRLEVEGMFNVNSTSVRAWRALLGHARNQKIPYNTPSGNALSDKTDYAFARTSIAGDKKAGTTTPGTYFAATEFTGYRVLDDPFLDDLAEEIVRQVRQRGPFLSLSEFVNRQLSNKKELAIAGAIQAALNEVAKSSTANPFGTLEQESVPSTGTPPGNHDYLFPEAAVGHNTYGLPGWTRQADVLRPLAPVLSARDDTFTIRAYGDSRRADGTIEAKAWCEATVCRTREYVDPTDAADITTQPVNAANLVFGRRFEVVSFRWLAAEEI